MHFVCFFTHFVYFYTLFATYLPFSLISRCRVLSYPCGNSSRWGEDKRLDDDLELEDALNLLHLARELGGDDGGAGVDELHESHHLHDLTCDL